MSGCWQLTLDDAGKIYVQYKCFFTLWVSFSPLATSSPILSQSFPVLIPELG